jgi:CHAT domain-containing protein
VEARLRQGPAAIGELDRAASYYRDQGIPFSLASTLVQRADALLVMGDTLGSERDLDSAMALVRRRAERLDPLQAASAREVERSVFERRVALRMRRGDAEGALARLDDHRTWRRGSSGPIAPIAPGLRRDDAIVAYAALPDQLVIWTLTDGGITSRVAPVAARELMRRAARLEALLRAGGDPESLTQESGELYRMLLGPVETLLRGKHRIGIVSDPALAGIPFAALRSPSSGRYLIEDFTLHHGFGVWDALAGFASATASSLGLVQVVGNPAFDRSRDPALQPLRHAAAEADSVAAIHPGSRRLDDGRATPRSVVAALSEASLFHFAGHALGAASGLQGSRLLLAPETPNGDGNLTAEHIAGLRLPRLRLAILSACETLGRNQPGAYQFDGLAEAFLAAGAGGVIGSLWAVDDAGIIRLMTRLHRELAGGRPPAEALRIAQLAALHQPAVPASTWAAFRYLTR